jgi:multidrug efflux system membrane fusion protein
MRFVALILFALALTAPVGAEDPPKVDLKKGVLFTGRTEANVVEICPRVTGYLARTVVKDGAVVKKGDLLAEVDDRVYKAELNIAKAKLVKAQVVLKTTTANLARVKAAFDKGAEGKEALAKAEGDHAEAKADVEFAQAVVDLAELNLAFTKLMSPIDGRVGRITTTEGNLAKADETKIVSVIADNPIVVTFDVDERTVLAIRRALNDGGKLVVEVGLNDEKDYPHKGEANTRSHALDPKTGSVQFRATLPNPKSLIIDGQFVRVKLTVQPK